MADITSSILVYKQDTGIDNPTNSPYDYKQVMVETPDTADSGDTFRVQLSKYDITDMKSIRVFRHSTNFSVIVAGTAATTVVGGSVQVTLGTAANTKRVLVIGGY